MRWSLNEHGTPESCSPLRNHQPVPSGIQPRPSSLTGSRSAHAILRTHCFAPTAAVHAELRGCSGHRPHCRLRAPQQCLTLREPRWDFVSSRRCSRQLMPVDDFKAPLTSCAWFRATGFRDGLALPGPRRLRGQTTHQLDAMALVGKTWADLTDEGCPGCTEDHYTRLATYSTASSRTRSSMQPSILPPRALHRLRPSWACLERVNAPGAGDRLVAPSHGGTTMSDDMLSAALRFVARWFPVRLYTSKLRPFTDHTFSCRGAPVIARHDVFRDQWKRVSTLAPTSSTTKCA